MKTEYAVGKSRPLPLCRWWLRTRPCTRGTQLEPIPDGCGPCVEFYVPWWAWPLELFYRLFFGAGELQAIESPLVEIERFQALPKPRDLRGRSGGDALLQVICVVNFYQYLSAKHGASHPDVEKFRREDLAAVPDALRNVMGP